MGDYRAAGGETRARAGTNLVNFLVGSAPILVVNDVLVTAGGFPAIDQRIAYIRTL